ncbi:uncharacterized protein isoform X2 [Rhodnius prolixus]|uniref:uncharacterized protein isoform X2 n=1 Tax=Rhodnius prolixus TaxID=13249 RepID=UPI003D18D563
MSDPIANVEGLCRLCLSNGENKSVFDRDEGNQQITFIIKIQDCVSIKINRDSELPTSVCKDCETFVNSWVLFKEKCDKAQLYLKKWLKNKQLQIEGERLKNRNNEDGKSDDSEKANAEDQQQCDGEMPVVSVEDIESAIDLKDGGSHEDSTAGAQKIVIADDKLDDESIINLDCDDNENEQQAISTVLPAEDGKNMDTVNKTVENTKGPSTVENDKQKGRGEVGNEKNDSTVINDEDDDEISILEENVSSTVTSSSNKDSVDNQSSCNAIKIASTVSLSKGFFDSNFDELNSKNNLESTNESIKQIQSKDVNEKVSGNGNDSSPTTNLLVNSEKENADGNVTGSDVAEIGSSKNNVASSELTVPDSTMTSPTEQDAIGIKLVTRIKTEPVDDQELSQSAVGEIRVKTEPEELVEEHSVAVTEQDEADMANNKCTLCNYVFSSNNSLVRHLSSRKHMRRSLPPDAEIKVEPPKTDHLSAEILPDNTVRSTRQKNKNFNNFDGAFTDDSQETYLDDSFFCKICNRSYCSASELRRHNRSLKHMRNLNIRAALKRKANNPFLQEQFYALDDDDDDEDDNVAGTPMYGTLPGRIQKDYICPMEDCNFACKEGSALLEHMMIHGIRNSNTSNEEVEKQEPQSIQKIYCKCKQIFTNNNEYLCHLKVCRLMNKLPSMPSQMYDTTATPNSQPQKRACRLCDLTFTSQEVYLNHLQIYHKGSTLEQNVPKMKVPLLSGKLWTQFVSKSGEILYNCIICNKKFKQHFSLNSHLRQHKQPPMRRDVCKICNKIFSNSKFFEKHVRGHFLPPNSRKLFCFKCYKTFDHRGEIIAHRATCNSMKMKIYSCSVCKHSFKDLIALKEHKLRAHTSSILPVQALCTVDIKEDPVPIRTPIVVNENKVCPICKKSFYNYQNMKRHCLAVHKHEDLSFLEYGPFAHFDEPTTSNTPSNMNESQLDQDNWACQFCRKEFRSEKLLIYHIEHQCPYLQHVSNNSLDLSMDKPPNHRHKHRCIICARFLPSYLNASNTVCVRCMEKFEENSLSKEELAKKAFLGNQSLKNAFNSAKPAPSSSAFTGEGDIPPMPLKPPPQLSQSKSGKFFQCPIGKKQFTTEAWMMKHFRNCDGMCPSYINCARCNLNFKSVTMYEKHVPKCEAGTIKRFDCSLCGKTYSKRDYVVKHKQLAHKKQIKKRNNEIEGIEYVDWMEQINFDSATDRRRLLYQQQLQQQQYGNQPEDLIEEIPAEVKQEAEDHQEDDEEKHEIDDSDHPDELPLEIIHTEGGDNVVISKDILEDGSKSFPCDGCSRVFNTYKGLANHSVVHNRVNSTDKSQYECKFCQRGDLLQSQIYSHTYRCIKLLLSQEPVVSCKQCQRNFNTSQQTKEFSANLISHVFDCYDIPYYKDEDDGGRNPKLLCYICCYAFSCPDKLRFHKAEHARKSHAKSYSKKTKRKFRPDMENSLIDCFSNQSEYSFDIQPPRKIFRDSKLFKCRVCNRPFFSINKLKNHEKVHGIIQKNVFSEEPAPPQEA